MSSQTQVTGTRVKGEAKPGDRVTYFDIMNQDGKVWEVMTTPEDNKCPKWGWTSGYGLISESGEVHSSDLRQHGWTFA